MQTKSHLAKHFREVHFGGNWTWSNLKDNLSDVTLDQALTKVKTFNTIATLAFHINYFVVAAMNVLEGKALNAHDKYSFDHPDFQSEDEWQLFLNKMWADGDKFANLVEQLSNEQMWSVFSEEKYGNYFRNIMGIIEHSHYHLGQIVIIKKLVLELGPESNAN